MGKGCSQGRWIKWLGWFLWYIMLKVAKHLRTICENFAYVLNKSSLVSVKKINHDISKVDLNVIEIKVIPLRNRAIPESGNIIVE